MTLISDVFVIQTTSGINHSDTDAAFEIIVRGPGGYEARTDFEDLKHDEREKGRTDQYRFIFDEPFDWDPGLWTVSMRMTNTHDGWLPYSIFVLGKVAPGIPGIPETSAEWVVMGAHYVWPRDKWFDRGPPARDEHPEHVISDFTWEPPGPFG